MGYAQKVFRICIFQGLADDYQEAYLLTAPLTNDDLINLIVGFIWENLFILLVQFFCVGLILRIVKLFID
jgi:hypothetical protein